MEGSESENQRLSLNVKKSLQGEEETSRHVLKLQQNFMDLEPLLKRNSIC
jgi:hypothetical protein